MESSHLYLIHCLGDQTKVASFCKFLQASRRKIKNLISGGPNERGLENFSKKITGGAYSGPKSTVFAKANLKIPQAFESLWFKRFSLDPTMVGILVDLGYERISRTLSVHSA